MVINYFIHDTFAFPSVISIGCSDLKRDKNGTSNSFLRAWGALIQRHLQLWVLENFKF